MSVGTCNYEVIYLFIYNFFLKIKVYLCEDSAKKTLTDESVNRKET